MLQKLSLRKALRTVIFLITCLLMTGCYTLRTVPVNSIPAERKILVVHADDNYWTVDSYSISDGILTAHISTPEVKINKGESAHIYAAPSSAVTLEGTTLTVPTANIAKADYHKINLAETAGFGAIWASVLFTLALLIF